MIRRPVFQGLLVCAAGTLAFFWPLLQGRTFSTVAGHQRWVYPWVSATNPYFDANQSDQATLNYPWQAFLTRSVRAGDPPLWNPLSFGGQPFFSNGSSGTVYPPRLLAAFVFSPSAAHDFLSVLHVFGGGVAMFLLCRELGRRTPGSLLGATAWMFASFNMVWLHLEVVAPEILLLPLSLLLVRRAVMGRGAGPIVAAAFVTGVTLVSGHLLILGAVWAIAAAYGGWCVIASAARTPGEGRGRELARSASRLAAVLVGGVGLFAFVLLPTAATITSSHRAPLDYQQIRELVRSPPSALLNVFRAPPLPALYDDNPMNKQMTFVGTAAGLLAVIGLFGRGAASALGRALALAVALLALDTPVLRLAYSLVPGLTLLKPLGRLFFAWDLAVALLAATGLDAVVGWASRRGRQRWGELLAAAIVIVNTAELVRYGRALNPPFHPRTDELLYPVTPLVTAATTHAMRSGGRIVAVESWGEPAVPPLCLVAGQHLVFGLPAIGGYDSVVPERALHVNLVASGQRTLEKARYVPGGAYRACFRTDLTRFELLPRLGVTTIVGPPGMDGTPSWSRTRALRLEPAYSETDGQVFTIPDAPGEAWVAERAVLVDTPPDALRRLVDPAFDFRREVVLLRSDAPGAEEAKEGAPAATLPGEARIASRSNNRVVIETQSETAGWLVVASTFDPGWRSTVDGAPATTLAGNYAFRAVRLPPGSHRVEMRYLPVRFRAGLAISVATLLIGAAIARRETR